MTAPIRVAINGFGRIGRTVLRAWLKGGWPEVEIVAINDIAPLKTCAYLFEYDSVFGPYAGEVTFGDGALVIDGRPMAFTCEPDLAALPLAGVDILMECTGRAMDRRIAEAGLRAGAARALISGPSLDADVTLVLGANDAALLPDARIVSNASCTTNATAPLLRVLDEAFWGRDGFDDNSALLHGQPTHRGYADGGFGAIPRGGLVDGAHNNQCGKVD